MKFLAKFITLTLLTIISNVVVGQDISNKIGYKLSKYKNRLTVSSSISYQKDFFCDLNFMLYSIDTTKGLPSISGWKIGVESNFLANKWLVGPKISFEKAGMTIYRISAINYLDNKKVDFRILPEIGLSVCGAINLTYGYNIPLLNFKSHNINYHKISISLLLDPQYLKSLNML